MIDRYWMPEMRRLFTEQAKLERWLTIEVRVLQAWSRLGVVPREASLRIATNARVDASFMRAVRDREVVVRHDVAAFVEVLARSLGDDGRWIHLGMTSSDVVDTAWGMALKEAASLIEYAATALFDLLRAEARRYRGVAMAGRTHGVQAEPITLGAKLALLAMQVARARDRVRRAGCAVSIGQISGPVGTFSNIDPRIEQAVCQELGLTPVPAAQVVARDRFADLVFACATAAAAVEAIALQVRLGHQTEVGELREGSTSSQIGSSAMPHKANPVASEQLMGLARLARSYVTPTLEDIALWHERDLTHSSVERVAIPDACAVAHYALVMGRRLVDSWHVDLSAIARNVENGAQSMFSATLLHALVTVGLDRDKAYETVQDALRRAAVNRTTLQAEVAADGVLTSEQLGRVFDRQRLLANADLAVNALDAFR